MIIITYMTATLQANGVTNKKVDLLGTPKENPTLEEMMNTPPT